MRRLASLVVVGAAAAWLALAQPASAAPSRPEVRTALLTTAQAQRISGAREQLLPPKTHCASSKAAGRTSCFRLWGPELDSALAPQLAQVAYYATAAAARTAFEATRRQLVCYAANPRAGATIVTSTPSTLFVAIGIPISGVPTTYNSAGYRLIDNILVEVDCKTTGPATASASLDCVRRLLAAQTAKAKPLNN